MNTRLVQLQNGSTRRVALVEEPGLRFLNSISSIYELVKQATESASPILDLIQQLSSEDRMAYDPIYNGTSDWKLLVPIDHPSEPSRCLVTGTGLTHLGSAKDRQAMHSGSEEELNDSMKMFKWGVEGGRPEAGKVGIAPEWFYKGPGTILRAHGESLVTPAFAEDGGEEGEVAGIYFIDVDGTPLRIGMATGNEFSDHLFEKKNYLNLAGSKLRNCSLGPELVINPAFDSVSGKVEITRDGKSVWSQSIITGEKEMCHSLANMEHHHFKFQAHRRPGDIHVHYYGACSLSFGAGIVLKDGDEMKVSFEGFGRPLVNSLHVEEKSDALCPVRKLA